MQLKTYNQVLKLNWVILLFALQCQSMVAQKSDLSQAEAFMKSQQFQRALTIYETLSPSTNKKTLLNKANCYIETNQSEKAQAIIDPLLAKKSSDIDVLLTKAYLLQSRHEFKAAIDIYKTIIKKTKSKHSRLSEIRAQIKRCREAMKVKSITGIAFVENLGDVVNTFYDDYGAVHSPTITGRFYFSSNRLSGNANMQTSSQHDMFIAKSENGILNDVSRFDDILNTQGEESILDISSDGAQLLFYQKLTKIAEPTIRLKQFDADNNTQSAPIEFKSKIKGNRGDNFIQIHSDTSFIYSSRRIEGKGAYDIYIVSYTDGHWHEPVNLGDDINTIADEICPYLTTDGRQLFFSSNRKESIGGYDIFYSDYNKLQQRWETPKNIGFPINSIKNDLYFKVDVEGNSASFSSDRIGSLGGLDLYVAYLKNKNNHQTEADGVIPFLRDHQLKNLLYTSQKGDSSSSSIDDIANNSPAETFQIKPLFFDGKDQILYGRQLDYVEQVIRFLKTNPSYVVELQSHTIDEGESTFELYSSIKRTEELVNFLIGHDIPNDRIRIKGFGNYFPINPSFSINRINAATQMGKRIHLFLKPLDSIYTVELIESKTSKSIKSQQYNEYIESVKGLSFAIQIAATKQLYNNPAISRFQQAKIEKLNDLLTYTVGTYKTFAEASEALTVLDVSNFQQLDIVAYLNGQRMTTENLSKYMNSYPDLENYIKHQDSKE